MNKVIQIAIDGPAGAGKSTVAKKLAEKYQLKGELTQIALLEDEAEKKEVRRPLKTRKHSSATVKAKQ